MAAVGEILAFGRTSLRKESEHPARDAVLLLALALDKPPEYPYLHPEDAVTEAQAAGYRRLIERRRTGEPVAYLRGYQEFMGLRFLVDRRVLIPRPETEKLVEAALAASGRAEDVRLGRGGGTDSGSSRALGIADMCCGCGAIGLTLAKMLPRAFVALADLSSGALAVARENATSLGVLERVRFYEGDLAQPLVEAGLSGGFDVLVSNPPYIPEEDMDALPRDVRCFEPRLALDGGPGGLGVIRRMAAETPGLLKPGGHAFIEIGDGQGESCAGLFSSVPGWQDFRVIPDYSGRQRVFAARRVGGHADQGRNS